MSETVRDAVFGNVGTMITFRVSADDAPILAKQFEPQFEAMDLLQMHNRHFILSMVINGEKAPAFSATTLTLPPSQINNLPAIIEYTRSQYSRSRADVEASIAEAIKVPQQLQKNKPAQPQNAPKSAAAKPAASPTASAASSDQQSSQAPAQPTKKKRTRSRKKKSGTTSTAPTTAPQAPATEAGDPTELKLR
jgi:hypothetical protein